MLELSQNCRNFEKLSELKKNSQKCLFSDSFSKFLQFRLISILVLQTSMSLFSVLLTPLLKNWVAEAVASEVNNFTTQVGRAKKTYLYSVKYKERKQKNVDETHL